MKNSYYFPHDFNARNDRKLDELFLKWKCEGRGIYWTFIEMLYENNGYLPLDKTDYYAKALQTDSERIASVINDFGLFDNDGVNFWSNSCLDRLAHIKEKSEKARQSAYKKWGKNANALRSVNGGGCERIARKESKVNKRKEKNIKEEEIKERFVYLKDSLFLSTFTDYLKGRKNKATSHAQELLLKDLHKVDLPTAVAMLEQSIKNGWIGIFPLKQEAKHGRSKENIGTDNGKYAGIETEV